MSYFNHAFKKTFVPTAAMHDSVNDRTDSLAAGAFGVFYSKTNLSANATTAAITLGQNIFLAQKSHFSSF